MARSSGRWWDRRPTSTLDATPPEAPEVTAARALADALDQHRRLVEQAAVVIAGHKRIEVQLSRVEAGRARALEAAGAALERARAAANQAQVKQHRAEASAEAMKVAAADRRLDDLRAANREAAEASDEARATVSQHSAVLHRLQHEQARLASLVEHSRLEEQIARATGSLARAVERGRVDP